MNNDNPNLIQQLRIEIAELKGQIDLQSGEVARLKDRVVSFENGSLPPHFHIVDRISYHNIKGGVQVVMETPSQVAEEGKFLIYHTPTAGVRRLYVKVDQTWRYVNLT